MNYPSPKLGLLKRRFSKRRLSKRRVSKRRLSKRRGHWKTFLWATGLPDGTYIFKPKIPLWVNFGGSCNRKRWYMYYIKGHLVYFTDIWYIL
jgi:hypothetical protein